MKPIRLGIADDHLLVINGLRTMLEKIGHIEILFTSVDGTELLEKLKDQKPDVLLLDIQMPGMNGMDLCKVITKDNSDIRIIALTNFDESHYVKNMLRNGAAGYLLKNTDQETLVKAIEEVSVGNQFLDDHIKRILLDEAISGQKRTLYDIPLTKREKEILKMIAGEHTNQEIAEQLFISLRTVETHRLNLTQKLAVKNTAGLVKEAIKRGLA